jgi:hypothetical protein
VKNRKKYISYVLGLLVLSLQLNAFSQNIKAEVDRDRIFIGEQIKLKLSVEGGKSGISWFRFPDSLNHLEVVNRGKIDTVLRGRYTNYYQTILITSFDSGRWEFPSLAIAGINHFTTPVSIDVLPVDVSNMQDYNDIKDIEEVKHVNNWLITGIIGAITLLSLAMVYWLLVKKKRVIVPGVVKKATLSPLDWALAELNKLSARNLQASNEVKKYYSELTRISRTFFQMQLQDQALQKTTDEWMVGLQPLQVENEVKTSFFQFLRLADTVKFAKYLPAVAESETSVEAIKQMLQKVSLLHSNIYSNYQPK